MLKCLGTSNPKTGQDRVLLITLCVWFTICWKYILDHASHLCHPPVFHFLKSMNAENLKFSALKSATFDSFDYSFIRSLTSRWIVYGSAVNISETDTKRQPKVFCPSPQSHTLFYRRPQKRANVIFLPSVIFWLELTVYAFASIDLSSRNVINLYVSSEKGLCCSYSGMKYMHVIYIFSHWSPVWY